MPKQVHESGQPAPSVLVPLAHLTRQWPGRALNDTGTLRILNEEGSKAPLVWIFNGQKAALKMATALGPDQPLIFGRSVHLLVPPGADRWPLVHEVVAHYAQTLVPLLAGQTIWLGSNCQGNHVAFPLLDLLVAGGADVQALAFVTNPLPQRASTGLPALLIYGQDDPRHDPFAQSPDGATRRAEQLFSAHRRLIVNAGHAQYLNPPAVGEIAAALHAFRDAHVRHRSAAARARPET